MTERQGILMVDDRPENLFALEKTLAGIEADFTKANSGEQALAWTLQREFALALLDVQMPGMDGYELAELLRGDPKTKHMPIIFLTAAYGDQAQIFRGYESGAVDYIVKPYDPVILAAKVRIFLEQDRVRQEIQEHRDHLDRLVAERTAELEALNRNLSLEVDNRRRAEQALQETVAALERSNEELQQFAYVASHDLQEPLRMVASYTQLLASRYEGKLDEKADMYIGFAVDGARRMQALVQDLLALSRVGTRGKALQATDSGAVLDRVLRDLGKLIEESGAVIETDHLPPVMADATQLGQVFQNLIANAIRFRAEAPLRIRISATRQDDRIQFAVEDNGIGIDPKYHDRIFVIFQRLHERDKYPGSGMGLAMVKKIVERHGGSITVASAEGEGARFVFSLPAVDERETES